MKTIYYYLFLWAIDNVAIYFFARAFKLKKGLKRYIEVAPERVTINSQFPLHFSISNLLVARVRKFKFQTERRARKTSCNFRRNTNTKWTETEKVWPVCLGLAWPASPDRKSFMRISIQRRMEVSWCFIFDFEDSLRIVDDLISKHFSTIDHFIELNWKNL